MKFMKQICFLISLFGFLCCNFVLSKDILAGKNYNEIEVADGGTVIGNVKYMGELAAVGLNLYRDWELSDAAKTTSEKLIFSKVVFLFTILNILLLHLILSGLETMDRGRHTQMITTP